MEHYIIDFIKEHFGCYSTIKGKNILSSLGTISTMPSKEFFNAQIKDANSYFTIKHSENGQDVILILHNNIKNKIEEILCLNK